jgi:hypothetical protein
MANDRLAALTAASEFAESAAGFPNTLRFYAQWDIPRFRQTAANEVTTWLVAEESHRETIATYRDELNAVSDGLIAFDGTTYSNAHETAIDASRRLLAYIQMWLFLRGDDKQAAKPDRPLDPALIERNWPLVRATILAFPLIDHSAIAARVARERCKVLERLSPPAKARTPDISLDAKALAVYVEHPDWTKKRIAKHLGHNEKSLAPKRCPKLTAAIAAHKAPNLPHGVKDAAGNIEAWE